MNAERVRTVQLDWCTDHDPNKLHDAVAATADYYGRATAAHLNIMVQTIIAVGPGGGWPVLRFWGPASQIDVLIRAYTNDYADVDGDPYFYDEKPKRHTVNGKTSDEGWAYGTTHDYDCPACQDTPFTASPRSETYWSS